MRTRLHQVGVAGVASTLKTPIPISIQEALESDGVQPQIANPVAANSEAESSRLLFNPSSKTTFPLHGVQSNLKNGA